MKTGYNIATCQGVPTATCQGSLGKICNAINDHIRSSVLNRIIYDNKIIRLTQPQNAYYHNTSDNSVGAKFTYQAYNIDGGAADVFSESGDLCSGSSKWISLSLYVNFTNS